MRDYYECLEVKPDASSQQIRSAYKALVAKYHPDHHRGHPLEELAAQRLAELNEAFAVLSHDERRRQYDASRRAGRDGAFYRGQHDGVHGNVQGHSEDWVQRFSRTAGALLLLFLLVRYGVSVVRLLGPIATAGRGLGAIVLLGVGFFLYWLYKRSRRR